MLESSSAARIFNEFVLPFGSHWRPRAQGGTLGLSQPMRLKSCCPSWKARPTRKTMAVQTLLSTLFIDSACTISMHRNDRSLTAWTPYTRRGNTHCLSHGSITVSPAETLIGSTTESSEHEGEPILDSCSLRWARFGEAAACCRRILTAAVSAAAVIINPVAHKRPILGA